MKNQMIQYLFQFIITNLIMLKKQYKNKMLL